MDYKSETFEGFEKKIDVHPLGPHRSLRKCYF